MLSRPNSPKRSLSPAGPKDTRSDQFQTFLKLTEVTGLTKKDEGATLGQRLASKTGGGTLPAFAKIFRSIPGVSRSDIRVPR